MKALPQYIGVFALAAMLASSSPGAPPQKKGPWRPVKDDIKLFSQKAKDKADEQIAALKKTLDKDLVIEAIKAPPRPDKVDFKDKAAVDKFFDEYASERFKKASVNGVYVLIVDNPKILRVEVGNNTRVEGYFTSDNRDVLLEKIRDRLKAKEPDEALLAATAYVSQTMRANHPIPVPKAGKASAGAGPR